MPNFCGVLIFTISAIVANSMAKTERYPRTEKDIYYDLTSEINFKLWNASATDWDFSMFVRNFTGEPSSNIFYSTDHFLHELRNLSVIAELLDQNGLNQSKLLLSFQLLQNSGLSLTRFFDVFYTLSPEPKAETEIQALKSLQRHISGILVEFNINRDYLSYDDCPVQRNPSKFTRKVSFPKYARAIGNSLIENESLSPIKVGLGFNETGKGCPTVRNQQQDADFILFGIKFEPIVNFPWTYYEFKAHLKPYLKNSYYFNQKFRENEELFSFKINLGYRSGQINSKFYGQPNINQIVKNIMDRSEPFYFQKIQNYAQKWTKEEKISDLVLQNSLVWKEGSRNISEGRDWLIPKLFVQEVDANPCQLQTMLGTIAKHFSSVIVNEFTWSAFARHSNKMKPERCPLSEKLSEVPPTPYLYFTPGICEIWNYTEAFFEKLLTQRKSISGWKLQALIFSSNDLKTNCQSFGDNKIPDFAKTINEREGYAIGCAVNMQDVYTDHLRESNLDNFFKQWIINPCEQVWDFASHIVIEFYLDFKSLFPEDSNRVYRLFWRTIIKEIFTEKYPGKEVILHVTTSPSISTRSVVNGNEKGEVACSEDVFKMIEFHREIQAWAEIHQIKIIYGDAYNVESNLTGLWIPAGEDGSSNQENPFDCSVPVPNKNY